MDFIIIIQTILILYAYSIPSSLRAGLSCDILSTNDHRECGFSSAIYSAISKTSGTILHFVSIIVVTYFPFLEFLFSDSRVNKKITQSKPTIK